MRSGQRRSGDSVRETEDVDDGTLSASLKETIAGNPSHKLYLIFQVNLGNARYATTHFALRYMDFSF